MLLVIDIGNTNIVFGLFKGDRLAYDWRIATKQNKTDDEYGIQLKQLFDIASVKKDDISGCIMACVVPPIQSTIERACLKYFDQDPISVGPGVKTGMPILYDNPREVGADRIVNAVAAYERYRSGLIIVDFGTATTCDCVSQKGEYMGGTISPGIGISADALFHRASKLPRVQFSAPTSALGKNTVDSIRSGLVYGYVAMVDGMVMRLKGEMNFPTRVMATGGQAAVIAKHSQVIEEVDPALTLHGLRLIYERNQKS